MTFVKSGGQTERGLHVVEEKQRVCDESAESPFIRWSPEQFQPILMHHNIGSNDPDNMQNSVLAPLVARFARRLGCAPAALTVDNDGWLLLRYRKGAMVKPHRATVRRSVVPAYSYELHPVDHVVCQNNHFQYFAFTMNVYISGIYQ